ncbi:MAG: hypothetical protein DRP78_02910 [Candidatus Omnitrophota bacterium]|nr:MAG: hypothetical protein DRP78_02910 [Candidatus Omnitrophota bacterium]
MKIRILIILILFIYFILIQGIDIYAFSSKEEYLWIEFGKCMREKDGSLTLPLELNYGRFPGAKQGLKGLDEVSVFYSLSETDHNGKPVFYTARIQQDKQNYSVNINSSKQNRFIVFAQAKKKQNKVTIRYLAKTSFFLFGHSFSKKKTTRIILSREINRQLEIRIIPEFQCWPQTGNSVKIIPVFKKGYLAEKAISLFDQNMPQVEIMTNEKGECVYVPREDKRLNQKGETAFKQAVIVAEEDQGGIKHISSYTLLLHRSRFKNYKFFMGIAIFLGTMAAVFLFVIAGRKRIKF